MRVEKKRIPILSLTLVTGTRVWKIPPEDTGPSEEVSFGPSDVGISRKSEKDVSIFDSVGDETVGILSPHTYIYYLI